MPAVRSKRICSGRGCRRRLPVPRTSSNLVRYPEGRLQPHARSVQGNARLTEASVAEEAAAALDATDKDVSIGGAGLAAAAIELGPVSYTHLRAHETVL